MFVLFLLYRVLILFNIKMSLKMFFVWEGFIVSIIL